MSALQQEIRDVIAPLVAELAELRAVIANQVNTSPETKLLTVSEVAEQLNCGPETVRRLVKSGRLKCKRIGNQIRIHPADLV
jgi:excisionase family DNA binding protein